MMPLASYTQKQQIHLENLPVTLNSFSHNASVVK